MALEAFKIPPSLFSSGSTCYAASESEGTTEPRPGPWGALDGIDCPECQNSGVLVRRDENGRLLGRECGCMAKRRSTMILARSGMKDMMARCTFEAFQTHEKWQKDALAAARRYAEKREGWFLAVGASGSGKTHLCTAICGMLIDAGIETRYMLWRDVAAKAKAAAGKDGESYAAIVEPLKQVRALYIDDLYKIGREKDRRTGEWLPAVPTAGDINLAFEIINARYCDKSKLTIISSELGLTALADIDEATGSRILERCGAGGVIRLEGRSNWRLEGIREKKI